MSTVLLIGVVPADTPRKEEAGAHLHLPCEGLTGLAVNVLLEDGSDDADRLLSWANEQNRILAHYIQSTDVLPISLGAVFSSPDALRTHLNAQSPALKTALSPLVGRCEYILRVIAEASARPAIASNSAAGGMAHLTARQSARDQRRYLARDRRQFLQILDTAVSEWVEARSARDCAGKDLVWDLSLLVSRRTTQALVSGLQNWASRASALDLHLRLVGPTPAYSFVVEPT